MQFNYRDDELSDPALVVFSLSALSFNDANIDMFFKNEDAQLLIGGKALYRLMFDFLSFFFTETLKQISYN